MARCDTIPRRPERLASSVHIVVAAVAVFAADLYYLVTAPSITSVAHACALLLGVPSFRSNQISMAMKLID